MSEDRDDRGREPEGSRPRRRARRASIASYLVILFAAAFLLLLMAYFQQQRQNDQTADALKQSVSAVDAIQAMMEDNDELRAENETLRARVEELEKELSDEQTFCAEVQNQADGISRSVRAMGYFWQIDEAYVLQRYTLCRTLIQQFEAEPHYGPSALPKEDFPADNGRFSPAERYQEIYDALY